MKIIRKIGLIVLVLFLLAAVAGWMMPRAIHTEVSSTMNTHPANVYRQINVLKNWEAWSPWQRMDPEMKLSYNEVPEGAGASYSWKGPKTGEGKLTITAVKINESIDCAMDFGTDGVSASGFRMQQKDSATLVTWIFDTDLGSNPFKRLFGLVMEGMLKKSFAEGLSNLKTIVEKMPAPDAALKTELRDMPPLYYLALRDSSDVKNIGAHLGRDYGMIADAMGRQGLSPAGAPFAIYYTESVTNWSFDACMPVGKAGKDDGQIKAMQYPGGKMVVTSFYGPYNETPAGHRAADEYIKANGLTVTGPPWERYVTDPMMEKDSSKWLTEICYPVVSPPKR